MYMKEMIPKDDYGIFVDSKDTARVDSLFVAKFFDKKHSHVLRDIENLDCSDDFRQSNFGLTNGEVHKNACIGKKRISAADGKHQAPV